MAKSFSVVLHVFQDEAGHLDYNEHRPHGSLGDLTPREFTEHAVKLGLQQAANFQSPMV